MRDRARATAAASAPGVSLAASMTGAWISRSVRVRPALARPSAMRGSTNSRRYGTECIGCRMNPSASSPANRHKPSFTPAMKIGMCGFGFGPGLKNGPIRLRVKYVPCTRSGAPSCQVRQIARTAWMYSRSFGTGGSHGIPNRRSTWALTCVPRPSNNRPPEIRLRSHAVCAVTMGLRENATATPVPSSSRVVACAASARATNGLCFVSLAHSARNPTASAARATPGASSSASMASAQSSFIVGRPRPPPAPARGLFPRHHPHLGFPRNGACLDGRRVAGLLGYLRAGGKLIHARQGETGSDLGLVMHGDDNAWAKLGDDCVRLLRIDRVVPADGDHQHVGPADLSGRLRGERMPEVRQVYDA